MIGQKDRDKAENHSNAPEPIQSLQCEVSESEDERIWPWNRPPDPEKGEEELIWLEKNLVSGRRRCESQTHNTASVYQSHTEKGEKEGDTIDKLEVAPGSVGFVKEPGDEMSQYEH